MCIREGEWCNFVNSSVSCENALKFNSAAQCAFIGWGRRKKSNSQNRLESRSTFTNPYEPNPPDLLCSEKESKKNISFQVSLNFCVLFYFFFSGGRFEKVKAKTKKKIYLLEKKSDAPTHECVCMFQLYALWTQTVFFLIFVIFI